MTSSASLIFSSRAATWPAVALPKFWLAYADVLAFSKRKSASTLINWFAMTPSGSAIDSSTFTGAGSFIGASLRKARVARNHFIFHEHDRDHTHAVEMVHEFAQVERLAGQLLLVGVFGHQPIHQQFTCDVAGAVPRLPQIQQLLETRERVLGIGPAARRPFGMKFACLFQIEFVGLNVQRSQAARRTVGEHDPHQFL